MNTKLALASLCVLTLLGCGPTTSTSDSSSSTQGGNSTPTGPATGWVAASLGISANLESVVFGNNHWVAVGRGSGNGYIVDSSDATSWTVTTESQVTYSDLSKVEFGNGQFVAIGSLGMLTSTDGKTWTADNVPQSNGATPFPQSLTAAAYGSGKWVAVDNLFLTDNGYGIWTSTDGVNWSVAMLNLPYAQPTAMTYGGGQFVIVGYGGLVLTSPDGVTWSNVSINGGGAYFDVVYANGQYVIAGNDSGYVLTSTDAVHWTTVNIGAAGFNAMINGGGVYVGVGTTGAATVYSSPDAQTWTNDSTTLPTTFTNSLNGIAYGNNVYVTVGANGELAYSP